MDIRVKCLYFCNLIVYKHGTQQKPACRRLRNCISQWTLSNAFSLWFLFSHETQPTGSIVSKSTSVIHFLTHSHLMWGSSLHKQFSEKYNRLPRKQTWLFLNAKKALDCCTFGNNKINIHAIWNYTSHNIMK